MFQTTTLRIIVLPLFGFSVTGGGVPCFRPIRVGRNHYDSVRGPLADIINPSLCFYFAGIQRLFWDPSFTRVSTAIQFTSQVLPPSSENACSNRQELGVMSEITNRTKMARPLNVSWLKNSPRPFLKPPIVGWLRAPLWLLAKLRLHWRDLGCFIME